MGINEREEVGAEGCPVRRVGRETSERDARERWRESRTKEWIELRRRAAAAGRAWARAGGRWGGRGGGRGGRGQEEEEDEVSVVRNSELVIVLRCVVWVLWTSCDRATGGLAWRGGGVLVSL